jgi:hypothetical protein
MDKLSRLFGSELRVKMMRLFLFNTGSQFDVDYVQGKTSAKVEEIEKEMSFLRRLGLIKQMKVFKLVTVKKGKKKVEVRKKVRIWSLNKKFKFVEALTDFMVKTHSLEHKTIVRRLEKAGKIKAVLVSGIFTRNSESRLDMFVVGDNLKTGSIDRIVKGIESDMGKDIRYAVLSAPDFSYRVSMNDKLVRDVLDFPHQVLVDKIGLPTQ